MIITADELEPYFCQEHVSSFGELYPEGIEVTLNNLLDVYRKGIDVAYVFWYVCRAMKIEYHEIVPDKPFDPVDDNHVMLFCQDYSVVQWRDEHWDECEPILRQIFGQALGKVVAAWPAFISCMENRIISEVSD